MTAVDFPVCLKSPAAPMLSVLLRAKSRCHLHGTIPIAFEILQSL